MLESAKFDATGLFSSRRCNALCELELNQCDGLTNQAMQALAINVHDSLESLTVLWMSAMLIVPLLVECRRLERLTLHCCSTANMRIIGQMCKAPLRFVKISDIRMIDDDAVRALVPVLAGVLLLDIMCSARAILQHIIPRCPCLQMLRVLSAGIVKQLRSVIPKHTTVICL
jgi:hypothetical protein